MTKDYKYSNVNELLDPLSLTFSNASLMIGAILLNNRVTIQPLQLLYILNYSNSCI